MDISTLDLPRHTHAAVLTGRDRVTGIDLHYVIVWADRVYDRCPQCRQSINREVTDCPVILDPVAGGILMDTNQQHGCGLWLTVGYTEVRPGPADQGETCDDMVAPAVAVAQVLAAAEELSKRWNPVAAAQRAQIEEDLRLDLRNTLAALAEPLVDDETLDDRIEDVTSGSETEPGVYCDDEGNWLAWEYDPSTDGETITIYARDLAEVTR